ncbi:MAG: VOC family protein [Acidimicrobiales bacterium]
MMAKPAEMPAEVPPHWGVYFAVDDADRAAARIAELGGTVVMGPTDIEPGRFAAAADPAGVYFNVLALKAGLGG